LTAKGTPRTGVVSAVLRRLSLPQIITVNAT
jgi:hypothetical protein